MKLLFLVVAVLYYASWTPCFNRSLLFFILFITTLKLSICTLKIFEVIGNSHLSSFIILRVLTFQEQLWTLSLNIVCGLLVWLFKTAGRWPWKSEPAKEFVTTHLPKRVALKMDGFLALLLDCSVKTRDKVLTCRPTAVRIARKSAGDCAWRGP